VLRGRRQNFLRDFFNAVEYLLLSDLEVKNVLLNPNLKIGRQKVLNKFILRRRSLSILIGVS
jgi:hypothetical protein